MRIDVNDDLLQQTMSALNDLPSKISRMLLNKWESPAFVKLIQEEQPKENEDLPKD